MPLVSSVVSVGVAKFFVGKKENVKVAGTLWRQNIYSNDEGIRFLSFQGHAISEIDICQMRENQDLDVLYRIFLRK